MERIICPNPKCGVDNPSTAKYCYACSTPLANARHEGIASGSTGPFYKPRPGSRLPTESPLKVDARRTLAILIAVAVGLISYPIIFVGLMWVLPKISGDIAKEGFVILICLPLSGIGVPSILIGLITLTVLLHIWGTSK